MPAHKVAPHRLANACDGAGVVQPKISVAQPSAADGTELQQFVGPTTRGAQRYLARSPYAGVPVPVVTTAWGAQIRLTGPGDRRLAAFSSHFPNGGRESSLVARAPATGSPIG